MTTDQIVDLGEFSPPTRLSRFDELTDVRNFVRTQLRIHDGVSGAATTVTWSNGEVEYLSFNLIVGYPEGTTAKDWR